MKKSERERKAVSVPVDWTAFCETARAVSVAAPASRTDQPQNNRSDQAEAQ
jgi:hypothetical protein